MAPAASTSITGSASGNSWVTYAVITSTAAVAVAGLGYLAYTYFTEVDEEAESDEVAALEQAARLKVARGIQLQAMSKPTGIPVRRTPGHASSSRTPTKSAASAASRSAAGPSGATGSKANGKAAAAASAGAAGQSGRKICAQCSKPTSGLPLRCSGCKQVYYCSQACQKKAWPDHKVQCKAGTSPSGAASSSKGPAAGVQEPSSPVPSSSGPAVSSPGTPTTSSGGEAAAASTASSQAGTSGGGTQSFQSALAQYLEETAASKTDQLEASFERAVMMFVKGEYRAAIALLEQVQTMAREKGDMAVCGETYKWLGHAQNRLSDSSKAQLCFEQGAEHAKQHNLPRLEVDCLGGLGVMFRTLNKAPEAIQLLERALALCDVMGDNDSKASTLCNLGAALMQSDQPKALNYLNQAVTIREEALERLTAAGERDGLATAVMEHANALVNLASALYVTKRHAQAKLCYERALEVFELLEDVDKVSKVLINLANMSEIHVSSPQAYKDAAQYRAKLLQFLSQHGVRRMDSECAICLEHIAVQDVTAEKSKELIMLSCMHTLHNVCWDKLVEQKKGQDVCCPTCKTPVPLFA